MTIQLKPETMRLVEEALASGRFQSVDEMIVAAVEREESLAKRSLYELLTQPPFAGSGLEIERSHELPRPVDLG